MSNPRALLDEYEIYPKKKLGQNFLHDPNALRKIIDVAEIQPDDTILEVGPGTGSLTRFLAEVAARVVALEVDERLIPLLEDEFAEKSRVEIHYGDILKTDLSTLLGDKPFKVVANLPYYITTAIIHKLLENNPQPDSLTVMMQREVAERIIAKPGDMSVLAVSVQFFGQPKIMMNLPPSVFWPRPGIDSAVLHMRVDPVPTVDVPDIKTFFRVVKAGFGQKRKQLKNSLGNLLSLDPETINGLLVAADIDGARRAETLSLAEWAKLSWVYAATQTP